MSPHRVEHRPPGGEVPGNVRSLSFVQAVDGEDAARSKRLSRDAILDQAEVIAAVEGTRNLTLRRLGEELGADHTAFYRYFRSKDALLEAVADRMLTRHAEPEAEGDWRDVIRQHLQYGFERYRVHPELAQLLGLRPRTTTESMALTERALTALTSVGLDIPDAAAVLQVMRSMVVAFGVYASLEREALLTGRLASKASERREFASLSSDEYPLLTSAASHMYGDAESAFEKMVDLVLQEVTRRAKSSDARTKSENEDPW